MPSSSRGAPCGVSPALEVSAIHHPWKKFHEGEKKAGKVSGRLNNDFNFPGIINYRPMSALITDIKLKRVEPD